MVKGIVTSSDMAASNVAVKTLDSASLIEELTGLMVIVCAETDKIENKSIVKTQNILFIEPLC
jgi:hypothetical protein